jgi:tetratricopeptide (TPR) repeat protein
LDPNFFPALFDLGLAYVQKSIYKEGIAELEKAVAILPGNPLVLSGMGYAYAAAGRRLEAQKVLDQLDELSKQKYVPAGSRAHIYAGLGEKNKAFEWLEKVMRTVLYMALKLTQLSIRCARTRAGSTCCGA